MKKTVGTLVQRAKRYLEPRKLKTKRERVAYQRQSVGVLFVLSGDCTAAGESRRKEVETTARLVFDASLDADELSW